MNHDLFHRQEMYRAQAVVDKAKRTGENIGDALREHMVSSSATAALGIEREDYKPRNKRASNEERVLEWARANVGKTTNPAEIADALGVSYPTANKVVQTRLDWFHKIKRGIYVVHDADAERQAAKEAQ